MIVYIDISDIQDEAIFYRFDAAGRVQEGNFDPACRSPELVFWSTPWWARWSTFLYASSPPLDEPRNARDK
jgi:hypothetical protein